MPRKGADEWAVKRVSQSVEYLGRPEIMLKIDGEPAAQALREAVRNERIMKGERVIWEKSRPYESQTNGRAESVVGLVKSHIRTLMSGLRRRYKREFHEDDAIFPWVVRHAAANISRYQKGGDGKTRSERLRGKTVDGTMVEMGEGVMRRAAGNKRGWKDDWDIGV